ncbi:vacuolar protein sorting-associated protein 24 homolog 1-like [Phalaenopsis equestris]|uniref:vacuolar protein sorting-associated protein 24 homolog 1-like n=1 Tax=Phalaenopsis equestris TaxID=78828 RepID=UPI0009E2FE05|nr:vacuolar protein sorting-associated protein 24 homolog 1-like [Phalaenopsis equestris]
MNDVRRPPEPESGAARVVNHVGYKGPEQHPVALHAVLVMEMMRSHLVTSAGVIEEMVNDAVDSALDSEDIEEETEEEIEKVLTAIAGETASQLPDAVRKGRIKQPASSQKAEQQSEAIAEGVDDEGELEEIRARLDKVRS